MRTPWSDRRAAAAALVTGTEAGVAQWFFGNLYEAVVRVPDLVAATPGTGTGHRSPMRPGSPVPYYVPVAPLVLGACAGAVATGWAEPAARGWLAASAAGVAVNTALTVVLVRGINLELFFAAEPVPAGRRRVLLRRWHLCNGVRIAASGVSLVAARRARTGLGG